MMDFTEKEVCVLCERGGKLLVCNDNGCPISVHEDCMGCSPRFNETGNFCCPYCVYRRLTTETCQLRDKAMLAKKALSSFLGMENFLVFVMGMNAKGVPVKDEAGSSEKKTTAFNGKQQLLKGKRKRWSEEEEDMLKEGVQKFSATANKNLPWKKVLEFGRHVFHTSRTPSDLKDKWRNMSK
ncbi:unnamed protein product [Lactuca saligna]|uniref:Myb-like domain-containing protein n=1 Tax=Lactuca saligna TaxID=75948 RepID=A0AA36A3R3_LACSI|nr:unnamed protein product [Lactuca saligna]